MKSIQDIAARVVLTTLNTSAWRATRLHKEETRAEQKRHDSDAPKVLVTICKHKALSEIAKIDSEAYHAHRGMTMPTVQDGMRMLPAGRQLAHSDAMRDINERRKAFVADFMRDYDAIKAAAPAALNSLYDEGMWPSHKEVESRFGMFTRYLACPTEGAWGEWLNESARVAEEALRDRLREALERVRDRCKGDGKLYASVFGNLTELLLLVPDLNLSGSVQIAKVAKAAAPLAKIDAEAVREDATGRSQVAKEASRLLTMLGGVK